MKNVSVSIFEPASLIIFSALTEQLSGACLNNCRALCRKSLISDNYSKNIFRAAQTHNEALEALKGQKRSERLGQRHHRLRRLLLSQRSDSSLATPVELCDEYHVSQIRNKTLIPLQDQINQATTLAFHAMSQAALFQNSPSARQRLQSFYEKRFREASETGIHKTFIKDQKLNAHFSYLESENDFFGTRLGQVALNYNPDNTDSLSWLSETIREHSSSFCPNTILDLPKYYEDLLPHLQKIGFFQDSVIIVGCPQKSLKALNEIDHKQAFASHNLDVSLLKDAKEIEEIIQLKKMLFTKNPELCWFYLNEGHIKFERELLIGMLKEPENCRRYLIRQNGTVRGMFGCDIFDEPFWGKAAGMDFAFHPDIQGLGLAKAAYKTLFLDMVARDVACYKGGSANSAVLKLAKDFGREIHCYHLRFQKTLVNPVVS